MHWKKLGLVFTVDKNFDWMQTHAAIPIPIHIEGDIFRIYFSTRNSTNKSHGAYIEIDIYNPKKILTISSEPILSPGEFGLFDQQGATPSSIIVVENKTYMYYCGWSLAIPIPYYTYCGLAILNNTTNKFEKISKVPIMDRTNDEPLSVGGYNQVIFHEGIFKMWYESNSKWVNNDPQKGFVINLKYAESIEGIKWERKNIECIKLRNNENVISRPTLIIENGIYKMWYSYKINHKYRIGYAESLDGINWIRKDNEAGIDVSETGWDCDEIEYPYVFDHKGERYMLYNGYGYGKTGFGLAKLVK